MEFTIRFLGLELLHIAASTDDPACEDYEGVGAEGDALAYPVGFTAHLERPDEADIPERY